MKKTKANEFHVQMKDNCCYHWTLIERSEELKKELHQLEEDIAEDANLRHCFKLEATKQAKKDPKWKMKIYDPIPEWFTASYFELSVLSMPDYVEPIGECITHSLIITAFNDQPKPRYSTMIEDEIRPPAKAAQKAMVNQLSLEAKRFIRDEIVQEYGTEIFLDK